MAGPAIATESN